MGIGNIGMGKGFEVWILVWECFGMCFLVNNKMIDILIINVINH